MNKIVRLLCLSLLVVSSSAMAGSFKVQPVRVDLTPAQSTAVLHVTNESASPTVVQVRIKAWSQSNGKDAFAPTRNVLATPPIFTIPAGGEQIVRVGLISPPKTDDEETYRIFLIQVPPQPRPGLRGLRFALRISIPIFVTPAGGNGKKLEPELRWSCKAQGKDTIRLSVNNIGKAHDRIWDVSVSGTAAGKALYKPKMGNGYLLAGTRREWTFKSKSSIKNCHQLMIRGKSAQGEFHVQPGNNQ